MSAVFGPRPLVVMCVPADEFPAPLTFGAARRTCRTCGRRVYVDAADMWTAALVGATCPPCAIAGAETVQEAEAMRVALAGWRAQWGLDAPQAVAS